LKLRGFISRLDVEYNCTSASGAVPYLRTEIIFTDASDESYCYLASATGNGYPIEMDVYQIKSKPSDQNRIRKRMIRVEHISAE